MPDQTRNLNSVTDFAGTLDSNDRIIMTDNKASLKALTTDILGKAMIEGYTGSSLAGSSQSVKSAIDGLNRKFGRALGNNPNFNNIVEPGFYYFGETTGAVNPPNKDAGYLNMLVLRVGEMVTQVVFGGRQLSQGGRDKIWVRYRNGNSDSYWNEWIAYATQSEVDALNSKLTIETVSTGINGVFAVKMGNIVWLRLYDCAYNVTGTIAESLKPKSVVHFLAISSQADKKVAMCSMDQNGNISISSQITSGYIYGEAVYITN